jgi:Flp pilus assembly protein TadG
MLSVNKATPSLRRKQDFLFCRRGAAAAEAAICLPVLLLIALGAIQAASMIFAKQALTAAAYEGARVAIGVDATPTEVEAACQHILTERGIVDSSITIDPIDPANAAVGSYITVSATAPSDSNSLLRGWYFGNRTLVGRSVMMKEF